MPVSVCDIVTSHLICSVFHELVLNHILDFFHISRSAHCITGQGNRISNLLNLIRTKLLGLIHRVVGLLDSYYDLLLIKFYFRSASLNNLQN